MNQCREGQQDEALGSPLAEFREGEHYKKRPSAVQRSTEGLQTRKIEKYEEEDEKEEKG